MAKIKSNNNKTAYLTKRILVRSARRAGLKASKEAMDLMGYTVVSNNGWIVKKYADGRIENIEPITLTQNLEIVFD